jgi:hypothetical protein
MRNKVTALSKDTVVGLRNLVETVSGIANSTS